MLKEWRKQWLKSHVRSQYNRGYRLGLGGAIFVFTGQVAHRAYQNAFASGLVRGRNERARVRAQNHEPAR